ncbi:hypothetical protein MYX07_05670 [Patescibacteria group bacterium AH-259-L07]|nr:hypothetical protein [Patescibacteria group bacterium AH-259-L07]
MGIFNFFNSIDFQAIEIVLLFVVTILLIFVILSLGKIAAGTVKRIDHLRDSLREEIRFSIQPKVIEMSLSVEALVALAVEIWRIEQRMAKVSSGLSDIQRKGLESSVQKLRRYLEKYDIEIRDYTNQKFNKGLNLDVLSVKKDTAITEPIVKETVEPTIMCKGQVVKKAKIILLSN